MKKLLTLQPYCWLIVALLVCQISEAQWTITGGYPTSNNAFSNNYSLAPDTSGIPYLAFADNGGSYLVTVKKLDGFSGWVNVGTPGFITGTGASQALFYNPGLSLAVNPVTNKPWIALADGDNNNKITVMRYNDTTWVPVGNRGFTTESSCNVKLAFTVDGVAYIVYNACYNGNGISVMKYNTLSWMNAGLQNFASGNYFAIAASPDTTINIAFQDFSNSNKLTVKKLLNNSWTTVGSAGFSDGNVEYVNISADADNNLYTAYVDHSLGSKPVVKKKEPSGIWTTLGAAVISQFSAGFVDFSINRFGVPYISFVEGSLPKVKKFSDNNWNFVGTTVASVSSDHSTIINDTLGNPWVLSSTVQPFRTFPIVSKYSPCNDDDYGFTANVVIDSAITQTGGSTTVTVSASGGVEPYTNTGSFVVTAGYYEYFVWDANGCSRMLSISVTEPQPVCDHNYWIGGTSNDWNDVSNWSCGSLPGSITTVYIETGAVNFPFITGNAVCKQMIVEDGANVIIANGGHIEITGP